MCRKGGNEGLLTHQSPFYAYVSKRYHLKHGLRAAINIIQPRINKGHVMLATSETRVKAIISCKLNFENEGIFAVNCMGDCKNTFQCIDCHARFINFVYGVQYIIFVYFVTIQRNFSIL